MRYNISITVVLLITLMAMTLAGATSLSISSITPANAPIDNGQSVTITGTWSGGTAPYNAIWYTGPDGTTCPQEAANVLAVYNGLSTTSNSITVSPTTTNSYCLGITDSESPQVTQLSLNYTENTITSGFSEPEGVAISPSNTYAYVVNYANSNVVIISTATNTVTNSITAPLGIGFSGPSAVAFSPSGTYAYMTNAGSNNVLIINTGTAITNSINSEVMVNTGPQISNPYAGGPTGYFGPNSTLSTSTTSITTVSTSTILPVTTISPKNITVVNASASAPTQLCNDSSGYIIYYQSLNATFHITSGTNTCFDAIAVNATTLSKSVNNSVITAVNYTINRANVSTDAILHYSCSIPNSDVAPFILRNGTWQEITPFTLNVAACTVEFAVPSDPVIALLNTNTTSTTLTTSAATTAQTSIPNVTVQQNTGTIWEILIIVIIVIVVIALFIYFRRKR